MGVTWADVHVTGAIRYPSPYKGAGDEGYVRSSARLHRHSTADYTQTPMIAMRSTSTAMGGASARGIRYGRPTHMQGFETSATNVRGGVTAGSTYAAMGPHKAPHKSQAYPGVPECYCHDDDGDKVCDHCGADYEDEFDGCDNDPCWCPIEWDWSVLAFLSLLSFAYIAYKKRQLMSNFVS